VTSCTTKKIITAINDDVGNSKTSEVRKVDVIDNNGIIIKTYYQKYNQKFNGWLEIKCRYIPNITKITKFNDCRFTNLSLAQLRNLQNDNVDITQQNQDKSEDSSEDESEDSSEDESEDSSEDEIEEENIRFDPPLIEECNDPTIC
tara:strand:- start:112 stop:549 length:438 start_codon:yes stop_codon:yes gene_type:complete